MQFSLGSDPEFMVVKDGQYHSAFKMVQGDAENRIRIRGHEFYYDNVMAECAVKPGNTKDEVIDNIWECLNIYADMVRPFKLVAQASQEYPESELADPRARQVGCSPDICAYEMRMKEAPVDLIQKGSLRSCGGHIHLGADILCGDGPDPIRAIYMMDLFLGIPSLWLDTDPTSIQRRALYGQSGRYRVKPYGLEYRSLGNFWLSSPELAGLMYDLSEFVLDFVASGEAAKCWAFDEEVFYSSDNLADAWTCHWYDPSQLQQSINQSDKVLAAHYLELAKSLLPRHLVRNLNEAVNNTKRDLYTHWQLDIR